MTEQFGGMQCRTVSGWWQMDGRLGNALQWWTRKCLGIRRLLFSHSGSLEGGKGENRRGRNWGKGKGKGKEGERNEADPNRPDQGIRRLRPREDHVHHVDHGRQIRPRRRGRPRGKYLLPLSAIGNAVIPKIGTELSLTPGLYFSGPRSRERRLVMIPLWAEMF